MNPPVFNLARAQQCLRAADRSYQEFTLRIPETHTEVLVVGAEGGPGVLPGSSNPLILAFRGTHELRDWITDAEFWREPGPAGTVHHGFLRAADSVLPALLRALPPPRVAPVYLTGHSLGGALAMLVAYELFLREIPVAGVITFGQPRVGDRDWAKIYDHVLGDVTWRVVHEEDLVPRIPGVLLGYHHAGNEVFLNSAGYTQINPPLFPDKLVSDAIGIIRDRFRVLDDALEDHKLANYEARIFL